MFQGHLKEFKKQPVVDVVCVAVVVGKAVALNKQRSPKHPSPPADHADCSAAAAGRVAGSQLSDGSDTGSQFSASTISPTHSTPPATQGSDTSGQDSDSSKTNQYIPPCSYYHGHNDSICIFRE